MEGIHPSRCNYPINQCNFIFYCQCIIISARFSFNRAAKFEVWVRSMGFWIVDPRFLMFTKYASLDWTVNSGWKRLRWSIGSVLAFGTQVGGFKPGRSRRIFQGEKILSTSSFGGEVKPSVPCRRFTTSKRFLNATWKSGISGKIHRPFLAHIVPPLAARISGETTSGESWNV